MQSISMLDARNTLIQHSIVCVATVLIIFVFTYFLNIPLSTSLGRTAFILLFAALIIGPIMKLMRPMHFSPLTIPWSWRGELGIWFTLTALLHFLVIWSDNPFSALIKMGGAGYSFANFLGLVALILALILAGTSFGTMIRYLGVESWKWLHGMVYVIFYLVSAHFIYFQFFSSYGEVGPDWFGYMAAGMAVVVLLLHISSFIVVTVRRKQTLEKIPHIGN